MKPDYLKRHFYKIKTLNNYRNALEHIYNLPNLTILETTNSIFIQSHALIRKYQLLSSDAVHAALCQAHNIQHIATNDKDFMRVRALTIWQP
jgi:predicted nucleic acid-binding protein